MPRYSYTTCTKLVASALLMLACGRPGRAVDQDDYKDVKTLNDALKVMHDQLHKDDKGEYVALLSEERVRHAIRSAISSYEALMNDGPQTPESKEYFQKKVKPDLLRIVDDDKWMPHCWFNSFYRLKEQPSGLTYEGLGLRIIMKHDDRKGFSLPIADLWYGRFRKVEKAK